MPTCTRIAEYSLEAPYATLRLDTVSSMQRMLSLLARQAAITPAGQSIRGFGYNEFHLGAQPLRDTLDRISTTQAILHTNVSGHYLAVSSYALNAAGVTDATPDPPGGAFDRYPGIRTPNGLVRELAR